MKIFWRGAGAGALIGLVTSQLLGLALIGTDEIDNFATQDDLPFLYFIAAVIGVVVGAVLGAAGLAVGAAVARSASGDARRRRRRGALAAAGVSAVAPLVTVLPAVAGGLLSVVLLGVMGGAAAWWLLPGVVDLGAQRPGAEPVPVLPTRYGESPAAPVAVAVATPTSKRVLISAGGAGLGAWVGTNIVMGFVTTARQGADVIAAVVLVALFAGLFTVIWRRTGYLG